MNLARDFGPDVALLDIGMPGMNGYEVAKTLRQIPSLANMTLVALTGWGGEQDRALSREAGFDRHLIKPVDMEVIESRGERSPGAVLSSPGRAGSRSGSARHCS